MRAELDIPYADARAEQLSFQLGELELPVLSNLYLQRGQAFFDLRVLGCSHQVAVRMGDSRLTETVACLDQAQPHLPRAHHSQEEGLQYSFYSQVERLERPEFERSAQDILARCEQARDALVAVFPGDALAFTALQAHAVPGGISWLSWHAYPQSGEIVRTTSQVDLR